MGEFYFGIFWANWFEVVFGNFELSGFINKLYWQSWPCQDLSYVNVDFDVIGSYVSDYSFFGITITAVLFYLMCFL